MSVPALIGLIGDVHAEDSLLEQAIEALTGRGAHAIVCVGDIADAHDRVGAAAGERFDGLLEQAVLGVHIADEPDQRRNAHPPAPPSRSDTKKSFGHCLARSSTISHTASAIARDATIPFPE